MHRSLAYMMDLPWLLDAYHRTRKHGDTLTLIGGDERAAKLHHR